jgi:hypothetical protein
MFKRRYIVQFGAVALLVLCGAGCSPAVPVEEGHYLLVNDALTGPSCALAVRDSAGMVRRVDASLCRILPDQGSVELVAPGCGYMRFSQKPAHSVRQSYKCEECESSGDITPACPATRGQQQSIWQRVDA